MLKYKYIYQNADCSLKKLIYCVIYYNLQHIFVPYTKTTKPLLTFASTTIAIFFSSCDCKVDDLEPFNLDPQT